MPLNVTSLERINGMKDKSTIRSPNDCLLTFEPAISLVIPVLVLVPVLPEAPDTKSPDLLKLFHLPVQFVCHSFHIVPKLLVLPASAVIVSNNPLSFTIKSGLLVISFHSSTSGVNATSPTY